MTRLSLADYQRLLVPSVPAQQEFPFVDEARQAEQDRVRELILKSRPPESERSALRGYCCVDQQ